MEYLAEFRQYYEVYSFSDKEIKSVLVDFHCL